LSIKLPLGAHDHAAIDSLKVATKFQREVHLRVCLEIPEIPDDTVYDGPRIAYSIRSDISTEHRLVREAVKAKP